MNIDIKDKKTISGIVAIVVILIVIIWVWKANTVTPTPDTMAGDETTETATTSTETTIKAPAPKPATIKTNVVVPTPDTTNVSEVNVNTEESPIEALVLLSPFGDEMFHTGDRMNVNWTLVSNNVTKAKVIITLLHDDREIVTITEEGGIQAHLKNYGWYIPDLSTWGEEGFSVRIESVGLSQKLQAESGKFKIIK